MIQNLSYKRMIFLSFYCLQDILLRINRNVSDLAKKQVYTMSGKSFPSQKSRNFCVTKILVWWKTHSWDICVRPFRNVTSTCTCDQIACCSWGILQNHINQFSNALPKWLGKAVYSKNFSAVNIRKYPNTKCSYDLVMENVEFICSRWALTSRNWFLNRWKDKVYCPNDIVNFSERKH